MTKLYVDDNGKKRSATLVACDYCNVEFLKATVFLNRDSRKGSNNYCSRECVHNSRRTQIDVECCICKKRFQTKPSRAKKSKSGLLFCSVECKNKGQRIENCPDEMRPSHYTNGVSSYRERAFRNNKCECSECGFDIKEVLEVHHIDGDRDNNSVENLAILCPTHHKMKTLKRF